MAHTRKHTLPSGRTIEVTYHGKPAALPPEPPDDLTICPECHQNLVYPVNWEEASLTHWEVTLRCPNCEWTETGTFDQATVNRFDKQLDAHAEVVVKEMFRVTRVNMACEADRFASALASGLLQPEDF